jgi:phosphoenolpyruvate synthase/pyruvate phosphate dikinase
MSYTKPFKELNKSNSDIAGGKGASLGEMINSGIPVPDGFVVLADTFEEFIKETDLIQEIDAILDDVDHKAVHTVDEASEKIQGLIKNAEMPQAIADEILSSFETLDAEFVAVRSSATAEDGADHAWAGQLDSYLNITKDNVLEKVQHCWASLFTPRAIFYRFEKELNTTKISVAVVVQKMVNSELSGIAFSVHPVTEDRNQLIIEAGLGLGEAIVSGSITPDSYVVEKDPRKILDINVAEQTRGLFRKSDGGNEWKDLGEEGTKQVISEEQILELSELIIKIENHYGFPCDIEWAYENNEFFIVQSRPITTLSNLDKNQDSDPNPKDFIRMFAGKSFVYLLTEIFLGYYNKKNVLSVQDEESWMSFLPKKEQEPTLSDGKELYENEENYKKYKTEFDQYIEDSTERFEEILNQESVSNKDVKEFFDLASKHFSYYSKTEFFYTDKLDMEKMVISVKEFDELKLEGRSYLNKIIFEEDGFVRKLISKISEQTGVQKQKLSNYSIDEVLDLVDSNKEVPEEILESRSVFFVSKNISIFGEDSRNLVNSFLSPYREDSEVIKGTTAFGGKVIAKARVLIPDYENFSTISKAVEEMEDGEILVAETTAPEIIQACKKASAIITNQGGMLSHAAIIARELKIPCIIGTNRDVVKNIKTGDKLEVDANNGIIRKIN